MKLSEFFGKFTVRSVAKKMVGVPPVVAIKAVGLPSANTRRVAGVPSADTTLVTRRTVS